MKLNKKQIVLVLISALFIGFVGAYFGVTLAASGKQTDSVQEILKKSGEQGKEEKVDIEKISQAYSMIKQHYIEDVDDKQLIEGAIQGMLTTLDDPYSTYMDVEMMNEFNEQIESSFEGIGAEVSMVNGKVTIIAPIKDSPAEKVGLRPNDQVLTVDEESLEGLDLNEAVAKIRGEKGSKVILKIQRPGKSEPFNVTITRDTIPVETVYSEVKKVNGKKTGVIEITNFSEQTAEEFNEQLTKLEAEKIEGLVVDVRGNPGGLLDSVEDILDNFVPDDVPYVQIEDGNGKKEKHFSKLKAKKNYPINVIVNEGSASASEIFAVAMKEIGYDVIGTTSFGKGTVQQAIPLGDGSTIKLTFFKWLSPKGNWIHKKGVKPTVKVEQPKYYFTSPIELDNKELSIDQTGENIANVQLMLTGLGYKPDRTDGYFSKQTEDVLKAFQKDNDLQTTGTVNEKTAGVLEAKIVEKIRNGEDDNQLEKAMEVLY